MTGRKKRLVIIQLILLFFGILLIYFTYYKNQVPEFEITETTKISSAIQALKTAIEAKDLDAQVSAEEQITLLSSKSDQLSKLEKKSKDNSLKNEDMFFDIEYTGLDLNGNRYLLKSDEAYLDKQKPEIVYMTSVNAIFYFKDNTVLKVWSDTGIYNNRTLNMKFRENVKAKYSDGLLFAEKADYSNTENYLSIYGNVRIKDIKGNLIADKLFFDINTQELNISSNENGIINADLKLNEKRF
mgnify:CR=1 FL=1